MGNNISEVNLYQYIASKKNPKKIDNAIRYIMDKGYAKPENRNELAMFLFDFVKKSSNPQLALRDIAQKIHPDKELFVIELKEPSKEKEEKKLNACGCSGAVNATGCPFVNGDGSNAPTPSSAKPPVISEKLTNTLIIAGVSLLGVVILGSIIISVAKK